MILFVIYTADAGDLSPTPLGMLILAPSPFK